MKKRPLVLVEWDDTTTNEGWAMVENLTSEPVHCISVGWIVRKTKIALVLAGMRSLDEDACNTRQTIPRGCIRSIRRIE